MARYGYARISTRSQRDDSQLDALRAADCERIWADTASGKLARRPEWDNCLDHLRRGGAVPPASDRIVSISSGKSLP
jgi:DNA invertase Pin-like site-specific DNA recombinase